MGAGPVTSKTANRPETHRPWNGAMGRESVRCQRRPHVVDDLVGELGVIDGSRDEEGPDDRAQHHGRLATRLRVGAAEQFLEVAEVAPDLFGVSRSDAPTRLRWRPSPSS